MNSCCLLCIKVFMMTYNNPSFVIFAFVHLETFLVLNTNYYWNVSRPMASLHQQNALQHISQWTWCCARAHTCCNEYRATLHHFPAVVGDALVHTNIAAVDYRKHKSVGFDADPRRTRELFTVQKPRDVGFRLTSYVTLHDVSWRHRGGDFSPRSSDKFQWNLNKETENTSVNHSSIMVLYKIPESMRRNDTLS